MSREPLSAERVLRAALTLADAGGTEALTMRRLGQELGVEAMSLYKHVANKTRSWTASSTTRCCSGTRGQACC